MRTALIIPAAGSGTRLGAEAPKAFVSLAGRPLLWHAVRGAVLSGAVDAVVIAAPAALTAEAERIAAEALPPWPGAVRVVAGGADRSASVAAALEVADAAEYVLVHDAARCLTPAAVFRRVVEALSAGAESVVPVLPVADTIKRAETGTGTAADGQEALVGDLDRAALRRVQTPQGFRREVLVRAHALQRDDPDPGATDDAALTERLGVPTVPVPGDEAALKITHPFDLTIARLHLSAQPHPTGEDSA
ncbi:2-C-methyl-D-erythritol 4-phosphate cytidylyltransferase [Brevibacterium album]|uniref:2-C-methyl-D-erythritol 4-phosphate cytidylyltransferase n=1 Tax=Brevibacterium album TaxID=417948 RepID=UPI00040C39CC|nr:2-C-methyl-D-erythritol 4-phosphate cytidylyltransferase [Brevibacterium album]